MKNVKKMITATAVASALLCGSAMADVTGTFQNQTGAVLTITRTGQGSAVIGDPYQGQCIPAANCKRDAQIKPNATINFSAPQDVHINFKKGMWLKGTYETKSAADLICGTTISEKMGKCTFTLQTGTAETGEFGFTVEFDTQNRGPALEPNETTTFARTAIIVRPYKPDLILPGIPVIPYTPPKGN